MSDGQHPLQIITFTSSEVHFTSCELFGSVILHNFIYNKLLPLLAGFWNNAGEEPEPSRRYVSILPLSRWPGPPRRFNECQYSCLLFMCISVCLDVCKFTVYMPRTLEVSRGSWIPWNSSYNSLEPPHGSSGRATRALNLSHVSFLKHRQRFQIIQSSPSVTWLPSTMTCTRCCRHCTVYW